MRGTALAEEIFVTRPSMPPFDEYVAEIRAVWEAGILTNGGPLHERFERELRDYLGARHATLFTNGHLALECVLQALGLGADGRDEVITTPFTFASTVHAIVRSGLKPVMCDVKPGDLTLDPAAAAALVTERTCAIVPVHVYGNLCDNDALRVIAAERGLALVYDAAHAFGVRKDGESVVGWGDASMLSFHATKVFNTVEGGAVCTDDPDLRVSLQRWRNFGIAGPEEVLYAGGNAKMDELRAAMGLCNLRHARGEIAGRKAAHERYLERLAGTAGLSLPTRQPGVERNYAYFPVLVDPHAFDATRDGLFAALEACGIRARKYFYPLVSDFACYRGRWDSSATPVAKRAAERVLCLPMYAGLGPEGADRVCDALLKAGNR